MRGFKLARERGSGVIADGALETSAPCSAEVRKASGMQRIAGRGMGNERGNVSAGLNKSLGLLSTVEFQSPR